MVLIRAGMQPQKPIDTVNGELPLVGDHSSG
jgi:hypothetical protein